MAEKLDGSILIHSKDECGLEACCFHNPSDHPLKDARKYIRFDRPCYAKRPDGRVPGRFIRVPVGYLTERICEHGVGHPDPDSMDYLISIGCDESESIHGCDGCCSDTVVWPTQEAVKDFAHNNFRDEDVFVDISAVVPDLPESLSDVLADLTKPFVLSKPTNNQQSAANALRVAAKWFDYFDKTLAPYLRSHGIRPNTTAGTEVQDDLRRWADELDEEAGVGA